MGVITHLGGRTAHEDQHFAAAFTQTGTLLRGLLTRVSHTGLVEASALAASRPTALVPVEHSAVDSGVAPDDLVLRLLAARTLRDRPSVLRRLLAHAASPGADGPGVSKGVGPSADGRLARIRSLHPPGGCV